ncbi:MAG: hypothetical protein L3K06_05305, partial [Thermoplasmata archaeon]|nr:hypothetical protein [Thermoplasmata archaeon]
MPRNTRVLLAVAITFLMLGSTGAMAISGALSPHPTGLVDPIAQKSILQGVETGSQLRTDPITTVPGTPVTSLKNPQDLGPVAPSYPMMFTVGFQMRNSQLLEQTILAESTPSSPLYHQWLTQDQERTFFGPDPVVYQDTINYFTSLGLKVQTEGLLSVSFAGTANQVNTAFGTQMDNVGYGDNGSAAAMNIRPLSLPAPIAKGVVTLNGLDGSQVAHPTSHLNPMLAQDLQQSSAGGVAPQAVSAV